MSRSVQPTLISAANEYCSRVVYIDLNRSKVSQNNEQWTISQRGNIRKKLTEVMQKQGWHPKDRSHSFIFYKRDDGNKAETEVEDAVAETQRTYPAASFQYSIMKPIRLVDVVDNADGFKRLFANLPSTDADA